MLMHTCTHTHTQKELLQRLQLTSLTLGGSDVSISLDPQQLPTLPLTYITYL